VVADRGSDSDAFNALNLIDPAISPIPQESTAFLVAPTSGGLGFDDLTAVAALAGSGEVVALSRSSITAADANGLTRAIVPTSLIPTAALGLAVDPKTGRIWVADDLLDEIWSVDPSATGQTPDAKELSFPLVSPPVSYRQIRFHDPGMAFATNGDFLVISDTSTAGGGGRLIVFHNEAYQTYTLPGFSITNIARLGEGTQLQWAPSGNPAFNLKYTVQRGTNLNLADFQRVAPDLTTTSYTDTNAPAGAAYYRVLARP
jgi:DNA-binding beta-propeller fold protein YncE